MSHVISNVCCIHVTTPVRVVESVLLVVPYRRIPVLERSVAKCTEALVAPESADVTPPVTTTRLSTVEVVPVLPARSVARTVIVLEPRVRPGSVYCHVPGSSIAVEPFTVTLAIHPVSVVLPRITGVPVTTAPLI